MTNEAHSVNVGSLCHHHHLRHHDHHPPVCSRETGGEEGKKKGEKSKGDKIQIVGRISFIFYKFSLNKK
jgi:hypothetical protein